MNVNTIITSLNNLSNRYQLTLTDLLSPLSVLAISGQEALNQPYRYEIVFTSADQAIAVEAVLSQSAALTFQPAPLLHNPKQITSFDKPALPRVVHGVITAFSQILVSADEAHYRVVLEPRLALLRLQSGSAIYQNQSVISVVETVLRRNGFTGLDYRLELNASYPSREFITQWQESDLAFIQRLLADIGVWFCFETDTQHGCDVVVIGDDAQGYADAGSVSYKPPSGTVDSQTESVWDLALASQTVTASVSVQDDNYRQAGQAMQAEVNAAPKSHTTHGTHYRYAEHYKQLSAAQAEPEVESGKWYAQIRHQAELSQQVVITGTTNLYSLAPGQHIYLTGHCLSMPLTDGVMILSVSGQGDRTESYQAQFTAIPFEVLLPYRPPVLPWPVITGTLPARVTSPDNDTYGYIDTQGRYRVKFDFDLASWQAGQESLWVRLARPYAGDTYGFHFPLIEGTEVAIGFSGGNPDRPYIAHALHDAAHPDLVSTINKHRNIIRTPANNKLRMDDKRGQEHIKLATEYGKSQLNLGHLVDQNKQQRGEGFELRTDEFGAIAANQGLYLTTATEPKAQGKQLSMQSAITQLENALEIAKALQHAAETAQAHPADTSSQTQLKGALTELSQSGLIAYAQDGVALTSPEMIQLSSGNSVSITAEQQADISVLQKITLAAGEALSLFAHKAGIKLFAAKGKVEIQAQHEGMALAAKQDLQIESVDGAVTITASENLQLMSGGAYIKLNSGGIELGSGKNVTLKCNAMQKMGPATKSPDDISFNHAELDLVLKRLISGKSIDFSG